MNADSLGLTRRAATGRLVAGAVSTLASACTLAVPTVQTQRVLPAVTADSFRKGGIRGFGFGVMSAGKRADADLDAIAALGANHVRVFIEGRRCEGCDAYVASEEDLAVLDDLLVRLPARGLYLVLVLGLGVDQRGRLWERETLQASAVKFWADMARRTKGHTAIAGFDLLNEPVPPGLTYAIRENTWLRFAKRLGDAIRAEDPSRVLIVESAPDATPQSFSNMKTLPLPNVVYSLHSYHPIDFTHQTVMKEYQEIKRYPDPQHARGALDALEEGLSAARSFAQQHDVPMYVGEFSAVRWAPDGSAARYVAESIRLFQAYGWSWSYHDFRGWHGWDAERDASGRRSPDAPVRHLRDALRKSAR